MATDSNIKNKTKQMDAVKFMSSAQSANNVHTIKKVIKAIIY